MNNDFTFVRLNISPFLLFQIQNNLLKSIERKSSALIPPYPTIKADCGLNSLRNLSNPSASPHCFSPRWRPPCLSCAGRNPLHRPAPVNHKDDTLPSPTLLQAAHKCQRPYFSIGMPCLKTSHTASARRSLRRVSAHPYWKAPNTSITAMEK